MNRRDFLKLAGLAGLGLLAPRAFMQAAPAHLAAPKQNVLVVVFDAFSFRHFALDGYGRETTPNIDRLARNAIVYHNHYAASNFTTPGTASLLTGTMPWTHRAHRLADTVTGDFRRRSLFSAFPQHHRIAYSHNPFAAILLDDFFEDIDLLVPRKELYFSQNKYLSSLFPKDDDVFNLAWDRAIEQESSKSYTLLLSQLYERLVSPPLASEIGAAHREIFAQFPLGVPAVQNRYELFILEDGVDWLSETLRLQSGPFVSYAHFLPPHEPYKPRREFVDRFAVDGLPVREKPNHPLLQKQALHTVQELNALRSRYDEFILYVDAEFGRLYENLRGAGILENTWLVLTSDHGEMFERQVAGHRFPVLYEPLLRVPLFIFPPGQQGRIDVDDLTRAIDVLPTLLSINDQPIPFWAEGSVLPPFDRLAAGTARDALALFSSNTPPEAQIQKYSASIRRGDWKLIYHTGYPELAAPRIELYNLKNDPEELDDLYPANQARAAPLLEALIGQITLANQTGP